jgi:nucleoside diphosphate kinase
MKQKTLIILKPDCVRNGHMGEVLARFEKVGFKVEAMQMMHASDQQLTAHYEGIGKLLTRLKEGVPEKAERIFNEVVDFMKSGAIVPLVLSGENVVNATRALAGATRPWEAEKGTIRHDFGRHDPNLPIENVIHASANAEEAAQEIALWFPKK